MKKLNFKGILITFFKKLNRKRKRQVFFLFCLAIISASAETLSLASAFPFLQLVIDQNNVWSNFFIKTYLLLFGFNIGDNLIFPICILFGFTAISASILKIYYLWFSSRLAAGITCDLSLACYEQNLFQNYSQSLSKNSSNLITNNAVYINQCTDILTSTARLFSNLLIGACISTYLILLNPFLAIISIFLFLLIYLLIGNLIQKRLLNNSKIIDRNSRSQVKLINEVIGSFRDIVINSKQEFFAQKYKYIDSQLRFKNAENSFLNLMPRYAIEGLFLIILSFLVYIISINRGDFSGFIAILGTFAIGSQKLLPCLQQIYGTWSYILGSKSSLVNILNLSKDNFDSSFYMNDIKPLKFKKSIKLVNISYKYPGTNVYVFKNLSLEIFKGEKIGIIGSTGVGKSTLMDIILGLLEPTFGYLEIDGINISDKKNSLLNFSWRKSIAHVPQNIYLNDSTIKENIAFGEELININNNKLRLAAQRAHIEEFILKQPKKYLSFIGENGIKLSGGQRQRIGIARAFYDSKEIFVLDEATSALDINTEEKIMDSIYNLSSHKTMIIISHRKNTLEKCNKILEISKNNIKIINQ